MSRGDWRDKPACVYRALADDGTLLYVGVSGQALQRFQQHASTKGWWREVASVTLTHYDHRFAALLAEEKAILEERPKYNGPFSEEMERRRQERAAENTPSAILARQQHYEQQLEIHRSRTMVRVPDLACGNCGWTGNWISKDTTVDEVKCPACNLCTLNGTPEQPVERAA